MGLPAASIYMLALMLFIPFPFTVNSAMGLSKTGPFPHEEVRRLCVRLKSAFCEELTASIF